MGWYEMMMTTATRTLQGRLRGRVMIMDNGDGRSASSPPTASFSSIWPLTALRLLRVTIMDWMDPPQIA